MAAIDPKMLNRPIVTGAPAGIQQQTGRPQQTAQENGESFLSILQQKLEAGSTTAFSKHAVSRVAERQIDISEANLERLDEGMRLAQTKGLKDALILIDSDAYIVNTTAGKVITVDGQAEKGSVFTNIDGTVIV